MAGALRHRGPDSDGFYRDDQVHLGMRRLKIIDLEGSEQPITNEDGSVILVCNGEIYNYKALQALLEDRGHVLSTRGDAETIVHLYEEYGEECVRYLDGMFAFAVWDRRKSRLLLARDRLGVKPLYWMKLPGKFVFGSEIRAVVASREIQPVLDEAAVIDYVSFPAVPAPMTIFQQIQALLPGHRLILDSDRVILEEYWDVDFVKASQARIPESECIEVVRHALREAVSKRLMSDVPLGAFLSGGIDSSAIVGLMGTLLDRPVKTFSIRFAGDDPAYTWYDDASFAVKIAEAFGTDHTEKVVTGDDIAGSLLRAVWAMDQPSGDALQYYILS
ncbi:MAG TPA: asparagine synthase (glutamine-hydrolyzing), partial [bacterium]|nr:asparagine synthase (glutamine-hydrolyzing) [bacterium]